MNDSNDNQRLLIARSSLVLFIMGLLVPILTMMAILHSGKYILINWGGVPHPNDRLDTDSFFAIGIGFLCEALALLLGITGRRHVSGRIGMVGSIIVLPVFAWLALFALNFYFHR